MIDLRSDTCSRPTADLRTAMANAEVIDTTGTAHPRGSSNRQCHVNFAEGCHLYIALTKKDA
jgi:threonine aldolase